MTVKGQSARFSSGTAPSGAEAPSGAGRERFRGLELIAGRGQRAVGVAQAGASRVVGIRTAGNGRSDSFGELLLLTKREMGLGSGSVYLDVNTSARPDK